MSDTPMTREPTWAVVEGDVRDRLRDLPAASVQCVVTSPPYWGLRDYGTGSWEGGDADCDHMGEPFRTKAAINVNMGTGTDCKNTEARQPFGAVCGKCGATRTDQQLGLEPTPEAYVESMVEVFREVRRVLRDDGTVWLNLGDSYAGGGRGGHSDGIVGTVPQGVGNEYPPSSLGGLKPKDLVGIPWRVAFALQADGWYLRSDIIWSKPNPMPESVTDRPTKSHEYVFLLSKSARYYFDADAVREPHGDTNGSRLDALRRHEGQVGEPVPGAVYENDPHMAQLDHRGLPGVGTTFGRFDAAGRNIRTVWNIATEPFPGAHFATFPKKLVGPCVKAGSAAGDTVLDPFCGSGTTGVVALRLGRSFVGIELNPTYAEMARDRIRNDAPLFNVETEASA